MVHPLKASFLDTPALICQNSQVTFQDASIGTALSWKWNFGNGAVSNTQNTAYTYKNSGTYTVQLIATDFVPCRDTATAIVQVDTLSPARIVLTDSVLCKSTYVTFDGLFADLGNTGVTWYFGDGEVW